MGVDKVYTSSSYYQFSERYPEIGNSDFKYATLALEFLHSENITENEASL